MLSVIWQYFRRRRDNYRILRRVVNEVGAEFEKKSIEELIRLIDNQDGAYEFEREFESGCIYFVLQQMRSGKKDGWFIDAVWSSYNLRVQSGVSFLQGQRGERQLLVLPAGTGERKTRRRVLEATRRRFIF